MWKPWEASALGSEKITGTTGLKVSTQLTASSQDFTCGSILFGIKFGIAVAVIRICYKRRFKGNFVVNGNAAEFHNVGRRLLLHIVGSALCRPPDPQPCLFLPLLHQDPNFYPPLPAAVHWRKENPWYIGAGCADDVFRNILFANCKPAIWK